MIEEKQPMSERKVSDIECTVQCIRTQDQSHMPFKHFCENGNMFYLSHLHSLLSVFFCKFDKRLKNFSIFLQIVFQHRT